MKVSEYPEGESGLRRQEGGGARWSSWVIHDDVSRCGEERAHDEVEDSRRGVEVITRQSRKKTETCEETQ